MTLARAGILVALAGEVALGIHTRLRAKHAQRQVDCAAWRRAEEALSRNVGLERHWDWSIRGFKEDKLLVALDDPDMQSLWYARQFFVASPQLTWALVPALRDPTFVGLRNAGAVHVEGRDMPSGAHMMSVSDDLFRRAGRASWLLKQATGHLAPDVRVETDPAILADLARDWEEWLDGLDGGAVCRK